CDLVLRGDQVRPPAARQAEPALYAGDLNRLALDRVFLRLPAGAGDREDDGRALGAGDRLHRLVERDASGVLAVDVRDKVAGLDACLIGGAVLERADDLEAAVLVALDQDADAAELALRGLVEFLEVGRPDHAGERVELGE